MEVKDWRLAYRALCESAPFEYCLLDTVLFDQIQANRPLSWVHTNSLGIVVQQDLRSRTLNEVLQDIHQLTAPAVPLKRYLPLPEPTTSLAVAVAGKERHVLTRRTLLNLSTLYPRGVEGLTLLRVPSCSFDPRVFIYQLVSDATGATSDDSVRIRVRDVLERNLSGLYPEALVVSMVRSVSAMLVQRLQQTFQHKIGTITFTFRFEINTEKPWLLGIEELSLVKTAPRALRKEKAAINVVSLDLGREIPADSPRYSRKMKEWLDIRQSWSKPRLSNSVSYQVLSESTLSLDPPFKKAPMRRKPPPHTWLKAALKDVRVTSDVCTGKYCGCKGIRYAELQPYGRKSRFLVPAAALQLAEKQEFSPLYHPGLLLKPKELQLEGWTTPKVAVCLRCYFVYCNVLQAYRQHR